MQQGENTYTFIKLKVKNMITCMQPVEKEEITLFKSGQIIRMDKIKSVYQKKLFE